MKRHSIEISKDTIETIREIAKENGTTHKFIVDKAVLNYKKMLNEKESK